MPQFIGCDAHKKYSVFVAVDEQGHAGPAIRVEHDRQGFREFLAQLPTQSLIAIETSGHYYWLVDEMERMGHQPKLAHASEAKKRMGKTHKINGEDMIATRRAEPQRRVRQTERAVSGRRETKLGTLSPDPWDLPRASQSQVMDRQ